MVEVGVRWCKKTISRRFPQLRLRMSIWMTSTASGGGSGGLSLPYADEDFDFVVLTSVFTHAARWGGKLPAGDQPGVAP